MKPEFYPKDGNHYADLIIRDLKSFTESEDGIPEFIMEYWETEIRSLCVHRFNEYIHGQQDFTLTDEDMMATYKIAVEKMTAETLENLVENGDVSLSVSDGGDILYSLSEQGKKRI